MKDKTLVVVFPSAEICNNIMIAFIDSWPRRRSCRRPTLFIRFFLVAPVDPDPSAYFPPCVDGIPTFRPPHALKANLSVDRRGGSPMLTIGEIPDQSLVNVLDEPRAYPPTMKRRLLSFMSVPSDRHYESLSLPH